MDFARNEGFSKEDVFLLNVDKNIVDGIERIRRGRDLSPFFAGAALLCLILEIVVSRMKTF